MKSKSLKLAGMLVTGTACLVLVPTGTLAADVEPGCTPAVSQFNGKLEGAGGYFEDEVDDGGRFQGVGTISLPLGCMFGLQLDVGGGDLDGDGFIGAGAHLFMRDPSSYLLGIQAQYINLDGDDIFRIGPEAELYLNNITLMGMIGFEEADGELDTDDFVARAEVSFYATENLRIYGGYRGFQGVDAGAVGMQYKFDTMPLSVDVDAMIGSHDYVSVLGGLTFYFGGTEKSLMATHREDDPDDHFNLLTRNSEECVPIPPDGDGISCGIVKKAP
jgi:hypothetical protein